MKIGRGTKVLRENLSPVLLHSSQNLPDLTWDHTRAPTVGGLIFAFSLLLYLRRKTSLWYLHVCESLTASDNSHEMCYYCNATGGYHILRATKWYISIAVL
jgi:hypothetical protein